MAWDRLLLLLQFVILWTTTSSLFLGVSRLKLPQPCPMISKRIFRIAALLDGEEGTKDERLQIRSIMNNKSDQQPSAEIREQIENEIRMNAPSELEMRMQVLGFTPWTIAGYVLAAIIISLNYTLGTGWASEWLGLNDNPALTTSAPSTSGFEDLNLSPSMFREGLDLDPALQERIAQRRDLP